MSRIEKIILSFKAILVEKNFRNSKDNRKIRKKGDYSLLQFEQSETTQNIQENYRV